MRVGSDSILNEAANDLIAEQLALGTQIRFQIISDSMLPTLMPGDRVTVRAITPIDLRVGDIVVWRSQRFWIAHRLVARRSDHTLVTKGDHHAFIDRLPPPDQPGRVVAVQRGARCADLTTRRVQRYGIWLARLSHWQGVWAERPPNLVRRGVLKICNLVLRLATHTAQAFMPWEMAQ